MLITDLALGFSADGPSCDGELSVSLSDSSGTALAEYVVVRPEFGNNSASHSGAVITVTLNSGIPLAPNETLQVATQLLNQACTYTSYQLRYTVSGYYAQP